MNVTKSMVVDQNMTVFGLINSTSNLISRNIDSNFARTNSLVVSNNTKIYGSFSVQSSNKDEQAFVVNSNGLLMTGMSLMVKNGNVTLLDSLHVSGSMITNNVHVHDELEAKNMKISDMLMISNGTVKIGMGKVQSTEGFLTTNGTVICDQMQARSIKVTETISSISNISTAESFISKGIVTSSIHIIDGGEIKSDKVTSSTLMVSSIFVNESATVFGSIELYGDLLMNSSSLGPSNLLGVGKIGSKEVIVESGVKAKSFFGTRMYTRDLAASGFISAETFIGKGSMDVTGTITSTKVNVTDRLNASNIAVENHMSCSTVEVKSNLEAGGITTTKLNVRGDIVVNGISIQDKLDEIEDLKKRIIQMESLLNKNLGI